jgi:hypothetical protein
MSKRICSYIGCTCEPAHGRAYCSEHCEQRDRVARSERHSARCGCNHSECGLEQGDGFDPRAA